MLNTKLRNAVGVILFVSICFCLFFHRVWGGELLLAADPLMYSLPLRTVAWNMLQQGSLPLWTPLILSGYPLLSMSLIGLTYPLTWGYLFLPNHIAEQIYVLAPFLLAPLFTYAWLRESGLSRSAALLAGLSFGYGGMMASLLSTGMLTNAMMWLPLLLIPLKRVRRENFLACLLSATAISLMSLFTGVGQAFLLVILLGFAWAFFQVLPIGNNAQRGWSQRLAPLATLIGAVVASSGIGAFQLLETTQVVRQSIRARLSYETFTEMSFTPLLIWKSFIAPLFHHEDWIEVTTFVPLPIALFSLLAVVKAIRGRIKAEHKAEVLFWVITAGAAFILMLGGNTPLYRLLYHIPLINQFRAPSRHAYEWSLALSILAAYGWDSLRTAWQTRQEIGQSWQLSRARRHSFASLMLLICASLIGIAWWLAMADNPAQALLLHTTAEAAYIIWKVSFALLLIVGSWLTLKVHSAKWQAGLLLIALPLLCLVEPYILMSRWWGKLSVPASRPSAVSPVTQFLRNYPPEQNRIYTRVHGGIEQFTATPRLDPPNLTTLHGLHNVAGYEPLMLRRYSRALGNAGRDAVHPGYAGAPDETLFEPRSQVLNILNTTFVAAFTDLNDLPDTLIEKENVQFSGRDFPAQAGASFTLNIRKGEGDTLIIVTTLANAAGIEQGTPVAKVRVHTADDRLTEYELRAGIDSAEWAHARVDVRPVIKHALAPTFDCRPGDARNSFPACRYWSRISLGQTLPLKKVEVIKLAELTVWKATLFDSSTQRSTPLPFITGLAQPAWQNEKRWQPVYDQQGALILRNLTALPRAWLVTQAEAVSEEEALHKIRGETDQPFDPRQTALLEIPPGERLPALPGGNLPPEAAVQSLTYQPNGLAIRTFAPTPTLLVVSEMSYPGWIARINGVPAKIYTTDYFLQGVALPAGSHYIEMRYTAPAAAKGGIVSVVTLLILAGIVLRRRFVRPLHKQSTAEQSHC